MERLDLYLVGKGYLPSRDTAQEDIRDGLVLVNGKVCQKPGYKVKESDVVEYRGTGREFVSRGAAKLAGAIQTFGLNFEGLTCIDVGASTGGFTQLMLKSGARSVAALDVGHDQLDPAIKADNRVTEYSGVNFRSLPQELAGILKNFDFLTMDVSFISVCLLADSVRNVLKPGGEALLLIKPQFEAGRGKLNKNGVLKDFSKHVEVLEKVLECYHNAGFEVRGLIHSPLPGPEGNIEYLLYLVRKDISTSSDPQESGEIRALTRSDQFDSSIDNLHRTKPEKTQEAKLSGVPSPKKIAEDAFQAFNCPIRG